MPKLFTACLESDHAGIKQQCDTLKRNPKGNKASVLNWQDPQGQTPLLISCWRGDAEAVELLLEAGADVTLCNYVGASPLLMACHKGHNDCAVHCLVAGADVEGADEGGCTPMCVSAPICSAWDMMCKHTSIVHAQRRPNTQRANAPTQVRRRFGRPFRARAQLLFSRRRRQSSQRLWSDAADRVLRPWPRRVCCGAHARGSRHGHPTQGAHGHGVGPGARAHGGVARIGDARPGEHLRLGRGVTRAHAALHLPQLDADGARAAYGRRRAKRRGLTE